MKTLKIAKPAENFQLDLQVRKSLSFVQEIMLQALSDERRVFYLFIDELISYEWTVAIRKWLLLLLETAGCGKIMK